MVIKMSSIHSFIMSLISAAAVSGVVDGFVPDSDGKGGVKKYLRWLIALAILLTLLSPLRSLLAAIPGIVDSAVGEFDYSSVEAMSRVNSLIALHVRDAVAQKFGIDCDEISAELSNEQITLTLKRHFGVMKSDLIDYIAANFGLECEVVYYE